MKKLSLSKETLRSLDDQELADVAGGGGKTISIIGCSLLCGSNACGQSDICSIACGNSDICSAIIGKC